MNDHGIPTLSEFVACRLTCDKYAINFFARFCVTGISADIELMSVPIPHSLGLNREISLRDVLFVIFTRSLHPNRPKRRGSRRKVTRCSS